MDISDAIANGFDKEGESALEAAVQMLETLAHALVTNRMPDHSSPETPMLAVAVLAVSIMLKSEDGHIRQMTKFIQDSILDGFSEEQALKRLAEWHKSRYNYS